MVYKPSKERLAEYSRANDDGWGAVEDKPKKAVAKKAKKAKKSK